MMSEPRHIAVPRKDIPLHGLLDMAAQLATEEFYGALRERGYDDIRPAHGCVFGQVEADGSRLTALAVRAGLTKQSVGEVTTDLERMGYVERVPDPEDRRAKIIRLTERGRAAQTTGRRLIAATEARWERRYGKARVAELRALLEEVVGKAEAGQRAA
jgi:DNA-binding MarR family transcriptional regulator